VQATFRGICATVAAMTPDQERWAEALAIDCQYGGDAPRHVAERIGALALEGDLAGLARWRQIAARLDQMLREARRT
jgi:hypothetical protein